MVEKASYENLKKINGIEIRKYPKMLLAVVEGYKDDSGFSLLFNYISGDNKTQKKIPMTAPVITSEKIPMTAPVITKDDFMAFVIPSFYTEDKVPIPLNPEIKIKVQKEKIYAVLRFSGRTSRNRVQKQIEKLSGFLKNENIKIKDDPILMRYNSPFTPGFLRRNEIAFEIDNFKIY
ncbi:hypothetical protein AYK24_07905 [Thermoplasmatales archaeon SG8-52-4]|nr:MAG: hypothetical protein AYK24_07905 [Thermoplasmatales archaeon SG8-52-4]